MTLPRVTFLYRWYDLYVGAYIDTAKRRLYLMVLGLGLVLEWPRPAPIPAKRTLLLSRSYSWAYSFIREKGWNENDCVIVTPQTEMGLRGICAKSFHVVKVPGWNAFPAFTQEVLNWEARG